MKQYLALARHWLPPLGAFTCLLLVGRLIYVGLTAPQPNLSAMGWIGAFLLILAYGLYRRAKWARWIAATGCFLLGALSLVLLITRFFPPGLFGSSDAPFVERPSIVVTLLWLIPPVLLLPVIAYLLLPLSEAVD
jgi:ABC-type Co2+ transport system permease subunit